MLLLRGAALRWLRLPLPLPQCAPAHFVSLVRRWARHRHWGDGICQRTDADGTGDGEDGEAAATPLVVVSSGRQVHVLPQQRYLTPGTAVLSLWQWGGQRLGLGRNGLGMLRPHPHAHPPARVCVCVCVCGCSRWPLAAGRWALEPARAPPRPGVSCRLSRCASVASARLLARPHPTNRRHHSPFTTRHRSAPSEMPPIHPPSLPGWHLTWAGVACSAPGRRLELLPRWLPASASSAAASAATHTAGPVSSPGAQCGPGH